MRACFLGHQVFALGNGIAILQTPPLDQDDTGTHQTPRRQHQTRQADDEAAEQPSFIVPAAADRNRA